MAGLSPETTTSRLKEGLTLLKNKAPFSMRDQINTALGKLSVGGVHTELTKEELKLCKTGIRLLQKRRDQVLNNIELRGLLCAIDIMLGA